MPILRLLATLVFVVFTTPQVLASPTFLYGFSVTTFSCDNHPYISCPEGAASESSSNWSEPLRQLTIGLSMDAILDQNANLHISHLGHFGSIKNQGVSYVNLARWSLGELDISEDALSGEPRYYWLDFDFDVSKYLTGTLYANNNSDELIMSTSGSNLWTGFIRSDALGASTSVLNFTGEWKFIRAIPEPNTLLLLLSAALAAIALSRKQLGRTSNTQI